MKKVLSILKKIYKRFRDTRGEINIFTSSANNDKDSNIYINHSKKAGDASMKKRESLKLINIVKTENKSALQKAVTEKISRIISFETNKS